MPDNPPLTAGARALMRARNVLGGAGRAVRDFAGNTIEGMRNSIPGTRDHDWRQTFDAIPGIPGNWFDSQTGRWQNPLTGRDFGSPRPTPGTPLMAGLPPSRDVPPAPGLPPAGVPALPNYQDPNAVGPPAHLAGRVPMPRQVDPTAGRQGQAGRFGQTIAEGQAAQNFARGIGHANSGLGASSYGRDRMMQTNREG